MVRKNVGMKKMLLGTLGMRSFVASLLLSTSVIAVVNNDANAAASSSASSAFATNPNSAADAAAGHNRPIKSKIFLLAGQSNMAGRGGVSGNQWDHFLPIACRPNPSIFRLSGRLHWEVAHEPLDADIDTNKTCGVGPGMPFARAVLADGAAVHPIGLVPCAIGGTTISEWARGTHLYENLVRRARVAVAHGGRVAAVLWYQGESDTNLEADAKAYRGRMERLVWSLRLDLHDSDLIIIQVALASGEGKYIELVREAQKGMKLHNVLCVDAKGLPLEHDNLHLTTQAQVELGAMLASAFLNHTRLPAHSCTEYAR